MNVVRTALAAALFLSSALFVGAIAGADDWGQALQWVDKYPSDKLGTNGTGLLDQPLFKRVLHRVLPKAEAATAISREAANTVMSDPITVSARS